jgi:amino acid adenylation domain-containing protein
MPAATANPIHPLSPLQEGMLSHRSAGDPSGVDLVQIEVTLAGALPGGFESAWAWLARRHAILRTAFRVDGSRPVQEVRAAIAPEIVREDWSVTTAGARNARWTQFLARDRARGLDPTVAPLWRVAVVSFAPQSHRMLFTFHHLLLDARALIVLFRELFVACEAFASGREPVMDPPVPYARYLAWLQEQDPEASSAYWREALAGFTAPTPLPAATGRVGDAPPGPARRSLTISPARTAMLQAFAAAHGVTLNTLVQGAWALLLSRCSGEDEVVFGAVRACRHGSVAGAEDIVGLMINTVPVRVAVPPTEHVAAWLQTLRKQWIDLRAHEHVPLSAVRRWGALPAGAPLFETIVSYQEPGWDVVLRGLGGAWADRTIEVHNHTNQPLALDAAGGKTLQLTLSYDPARFTATAIERMLGHVATLLDGLSAQSDRTLAELPLLTFTEENTLRRLGQGAPVDFSDSLCVHQLFEEQVAQSPLALAVSDPTCQLTYADLNTRATRLARHLHLLGAGPGSLVGVCLNPSVDLITAFLAVLKAGAAYVPFDPAYPRERLEFLMRDAGLKILLTESKLVDQLPAGEAQLIVVDGPAPKSVPSLAIRSAVNVSRDDLAYLIYTSGSTGQPKGVPIRHRSLANLVAWHRTTYQVTPADRATQLASPAFDACVWELWPYLTAGASVHIPDRDVRLSPGNLVQWLAHQRITLCFLATPLAEAVMDESWPAETALRAILTGGDRLRRWPGDRLPCRLMNHYGPTECTVLATFAEVPRTGEGAPAIGRPMANTEILVLDRHGRRVPCGVPGELHVGGAGLAAGYHRRPELTAEKFVVHPFDPSGEARLYRTGDIVRWREDGQLDYLGRLDEQVKIRGHRIEPAEIEAALGRHPGVRECLVVCREDAGQEPRLVAYLLARLESNPPPADELADYLHRQLPAYMVPSAFLLLPAWPLTANGKIDRRQLPAPAAVASEPARRVVPRPGIESIIADAWGEVLGRRELSASDDFFDLGGHSLRAAQVVSRLNAALGLTLSVRHLFDHSTITSLAAAIGPLIPATTPATPGRREIAQRC